MFDFNLRPSVLTIDGDIQSIYVYFREDIAIKEALRFHTPEMGRVLVYVGEDNLPVALQAVDQLGADEVGLDASPMPPQDARLFLFGLASKMIAFAEAQRKRLGEALIRDAVRAMKSLPPADCHSEK